MNYKLYHGSNTKIEKFIISNDLITDAIMQEGPGIYFTTSIKEAIDSLLSSYETPKERFEQIWFDFYRNDPALYCQNMVKFGYDGFIINKKEGIKHAIVFNTNTIKIIKIIPKNEIQEDLNLLEKLSNKKVVFKNI